MLRETRDWESSGSKENGTGDSIRSNLKYLIEVARDRFRSSIGLGSKTMNRKQLALFICCVGAMLALGTTSAEAQARRHVRPPIAKYQPYTSPYLSLFGPGGADYNYFVNAQPQEQFRQQQYNFNRDYASFQNTVNADFQKLGSEFAGPGVGVMRTIGTTGHPTMFGNTSTYFPSTPIGRP